MHWLLRFGGSVNVGEVLGGEGFEFAAYGIGREAGTKKTAVERRDFVVGDLATSQFQFAADAETDGGAFGVGVSAFGDGGFDVGVGNATGAKVTRNAIFPLSADLSALASKLFGVAVVVDHAVFLETGHDDLGEKLVVGAAAQDFFHFGNGVRAAHECALGGFVEVGFGVEFTGLAEHERRMK